MGYLRFECQDCGRMIYMSNRVDGVWRAYKSWAAGDVAENEWELHSCPSAERRADTLARQTPQVLERVVNQDDEPDGDQIPDDQPESYPVSWDDVMLEIAPDELDAELQQEVLAALRAENRALRDQNEILRRQIDVLRKKKTIAGI